MGFMDELSKAVDTILKETEGKSMEELQAKAANILFGGANVSNIFGTAGTGGRVAGEYTEADFTRESVLQTIDPAIVQMQFNAEVKRRAAVKKPGQYCDASCLFNEENCKHCLQCQQKFAEAIRNLEKMEEYLDLSPDEVRAKAPLRRIEKCTACDAPYQQGTSVCPYCGAPYPETTEDFEIPLSKIERKETYYRMAEEALKYRAENMAEVCRNFDREEGNDWFHLLVRMPDVRQKTLKYLDLTGEQIKAGADIYQVPISEYLHNLGKTIMKTPQQLADEQALMRDKEASRQRLAAVTESLQRSSQSFAQEIQQRQGQIHQPTQYNGGANRSCGNCMYYYDGDKCANGQYSGGASGYCALWKLK
ncbi:MAG: hypothetical protein IKE28_00940 [Solobacterium sp.]|nr:hypothetical protein [Solobacterium sp.]